LNGNPVAIWTCDLPGGGGSSGSFFASPSWALYSISNQATATHTFIGGNLLNNQSVTLNFANGGMASGHSVGINFLAGNTVVFSLYFLGGGGGDYTYNDAGGTGLDSGVGFSYFGTNALSFTLTNTGYSASFGGASPSHSWSGTLANIAVDQIQVYNDSHQNTGDNQVYWNSLSVSGVPEPSTFGAALGIAMLSLAVKRRLRNRRS
ncbi:MAG: PEP-CTERM sorting domain-containing protein, partial [Chthoniobacterales bacterium]